MRNVFILGVVILSIAAGIYYLLSNYGELPALPSVPVQPSKNLIAPTNQDNGKDPEVIVIAEGLDTPWAIAFLPDGGMLVTERKGAVRLIDDAGKLNPTPVATISDAEEVGEGGLMGMVLHPDFSSNNFVYLYYTYSSLGNDTLNRVVRMTYQSGKFVDERIIVDRIPGASNHDGGRIKFGPDKFLYITTGDAQEPSLAQDRNSLAGKILRITDEGKAAPGNPFGTRVYSYGHRNPQGLAWDSSGQLWETEHGPSGGSLGTGNDEVNRIDPGKNYGWPVIQGDQTRDGMVTPVRNSGSSATWAPAGTAFLPAGRHGVDNSLFFGGLRGQTLYEVVVQNNQVIDFKEHFKGKLGRIREVIVGPDGMLYISTSNRDGRGTPSQSDDKIVRVNPQKL